MAPTDNRHELPGGDRRRDRRKIPLERAPGPDGIPDFVVKRLAIEKPETMRAIFNMCLGEGIFPEKWKAAKLVLFQKGKKTLDQPSSYRPICLLNLSGKMLERVLKA